MTKVVMISGASRGIGCAIASRLADEGYLLSLGLRDLTAAPTELLSDQVRAFAFDKAQAGSADAWVAATVAAFGRIDAVIDCAGVLRLVKLDDRDETGLDEMLEVNLKGSWRLARAAIPHLKAAGCGRYVSLVSMSGKRVKGLSAGYSMSKFAQLALHQSIRNAGWESGVRATAICPSWVNTDMARAVSSLQPEAMTQPEDIAALVSSVLKLPNSAVVDEICVNCNLEV